MTLGRTIALLVLIGTLPSGVVRAGDGASSDWKGSLQLRADRYRHSTDETQAWIDARTSWHRALGAWSWQVDASLWADTHGDTARGAQIFRLDDRTALRPLLRLDQFWLRYRHADWSVQLGRQPISWGVTDTVRPADVAMPYDWTDPLTERRLEPIALRITRRTLRSEWEWFASEPPAFSRLPAAPNRWASGVALAESQPVSRRLNHVPWGVRWQRRGDRVESSVYLYDGYDDTPSIDFVQAIDGNGNPIGGPRLVARAIQQRTAAAALWGAAGPVTLRVEAAYSDNRYRHDAWVGAVEMEWAPGEWRVIVGYADTALNGKAGDSSSTLQSSLDRAFLPALLVHIERGALTSWRVSLQIMAGTSSNQQLVRAEGSWPLPHDLRLTARAESLRGDRDTLFGSWRNNDRVTIATTWSW